MKTISLILMLVTVPAFTQVFTGIDVIIQQGVDDKQYPGGCVIAGTATEILYHRAYGCMTYSTNSNPADTSLLYDLASMTKVIATTSCVMKLYESGQVHLDSTVASYMPPFGQNGKAGITLRNCLLHNSGLAAYYSPSQQETPQQILDAIYAMGLTYTTGTQTVYSCLNFVTLAKVVEAVSGQNINQYLQEIVCQPLGLTRTLYTPPELLRAQCMPTLSNRQGEVHDPLAYGLGGLSGNAGLFSTTGELAVIAQMYLNAGMHRGARFFESATIDLFTRRQSASSTRALGWDTKSTEGYSSAGTLFSEQSFGHTGYTGTSIWIDPVRGLFIILLTNRTYPNSSGGEGNVGTIRAAVADALVRIVEGQVPQPTLGIVRHATSGEILVRWSPHPDFGPIEGTRLYTDDGSGFELYGEFFPNEDMLLLPGDAGADGALAFQAVSFAGETLSEPSDIYAINGESAIRASARTLIVDGFDRIASWSLPYHDFVRVHSRALGDSVHFHSCDNDAFLQGYLNIENYDTIFWILGDESTADETFNLTEQNLVAQFLRNGGRLFLSGSEVGYDLMGAASSSHDQAFFKAILQADYVEDDAGVNEAQGVAGSIFDGLSLAFGTGDALYPEDYPDVIASQPNARLCLQYANGKGAAIQFEGSVLGSPHLAKIVYLAFPFETIVGEETRAAVMQRVLQFFRAEPNGVPDGECTNVVGAFRLLPNYPNPFNQRTTIAFNLPKADNIRLAIFNSLGREVRLLIRGNLPAGSHSIPWDGCDAAGAAVASGIYWARLQSASMQLTQPMLLQR
ncbi:serine hydrolase [candidate division KSB1 bacterium]|nr:serine hydrolase [candidate division KSB1 bacterium]